MPEPTPFHARTAALNTSYRWKDWAGFLAPCAYTSYSEREYHAIRHSSALIDVSPLYKYDISGPGASRLLSRVTCRDVGGMSAGRVTYTCWCDNDGKVLDDGTIACLGPEHFRLTSSEPWMWWLQAHARGLRVDIEDTSRRIASLSLQGPTSRAVLSEIADFDMGKMRFFRIRRMTLGEIEVHVSRTGYTGDLGYEIWMDAEHALPIWDLILDAGHRHGVEPVGLDAMDVSRLEAGFVLQGVDYVSARSCIIEARKSTPVEAGLGNTVELDREPFVGQAALLRERDRGAEWAMVALDIDWGETEAHYARHGLPPELPHAAWRTGVPVYDGGGRRQIGYATSGTWSPLLKKNIALATVPTAFAGEGTRLRIEHTVEFRRYTVTATVVPRPFYDPERKRSTPGAGGRS